MSSRNRLKIALAPFALAAALMSAGAAFAHPEGSSAGSSGVRGEMLTSIQDAEDKLVQLAEAMPEAKYGWAPDKGVRTVGEVFMHVAAANFGIPSFVGVKPPEGFKFDTYEHSLTKKADIIKAMKDSFTHMTTAFKGMSDEDLDKPAEFFGMKTTHRGAFVILLGHAHEHLGQAIAYARSNKVTPPWTAKQQAEEAKAKKK